MGCQKDHQKDQKVVSEICSKERDHKLLVDFQVSPGLLCMTESASSCYKHFLERTLQTLC